MARYVKYVGTSHWRRITRQEWAELNPPVDSPTLEWNSANGWTIPADRITDDAWPYIEADHELVVVDKDYRSVATTDGDTSTVDIREYPPLVTAQQAEQMDLADDGMPNVAPVVVQSTQPMDQQSGAVSVDAEVREAEE